MIGNCLFNRTLKSRMFLKVDTSIHVTIVLPLYYANESEPWLLCVLYLQTVIHIDVCLADLFHIVCMNYLAVYFLTLLLIFDFQNESLPICEKELNNDRSAENVDCSLLQDYLTYRVFTIHPKSHAVFTIHPITSSAVCLIDLCFFFRIKLIENRTMHSSHLT